MCLLKLDVPDLVLNNIGNISGLNEFVKDIIDPIIVPILSGCFCKGSAQIILYS